MRRYRDTTTILVRRTEERRYRRDRRTSFQRGIGGRSSMTGFSLSELSSLRSLRAGLWELAMEMVGRRIQQDLYTYNTLLAAICKGGKLNLAVEIMSEMELLHLNLLEKLTILIIDALGKSAAAL